MAENIVRPFLPSHLPAKCPALSAKVDGLESAGLLPARTQPLDKVVRHVDDATFAGLGDLCWQVDVLSLEIHHVPRHAGGFSGRTPPKQPTAMIGTRSIGETLIESAPNLSRQKSFTLVHLQRKTLPIRGRAACGLHRSRESVRQISSLSIRPLIPRHGFSAMWCWFTAQVNKTERFRSMLHSPTSLNLQSLRNLRMSSLVIPLIAFRL